MTKEELQAAVDAAPYWYHRIELPFGITTPGWAPIDKHAYRVPLDISGKRVLDIGAWDGYWTFEALARGAEYVVAIDDFSDTIGAITNASRVGKWETFDLCRNALGYELKCTRLESSVYDLYGDNYDVVFCFGLLYHLKHPGFALETIKKHMVPGGTIHIETAILDGLRSAYNGEVQYDGSECLFEFFPGSEFGKNPSNWYVGTLRAWMSLVASCGFSDVKGWRLTDEPLDLSQVRGFIKAVA